MDLKGKLRQGMRIFGDNDRDYGTVERFDDDYVYVGGRRVPTSALGRMEGDRLYVRQSGAQHFTGGQAAEARARTAERGTRGPGPQGRRAVQEAQGQVGR